MELYMVCLLIAIALAMLIIKGIQCVMSFTHPMPNKELQWRRSPRLPSQELRAKSKKPDKQTKPWKKRTEKQPLAHAEIPLESVFIEDDSTGISVARDSPPTDRPDTSERLHRYERTERVERAERVERGDSRATMV